MQEKELRKMTRIELIEIIYAYQQNEKELNEKIERLQAKLDEKLLVLENAGSIAEAALKINNVYADAEVAANQYRDSVMRKADIEAYELKQKTIAECKAVKAKVEKYAAIKAKTDRFDEATIKDIFSGSSMSINSSSLGENNEENL